MVVSSVVTRPPASPGLGPGATQMYIYMQVVNLDICKLAQDADQEKLTGHTEQSQTSVFANHCLHGNPLSDHCWCIDPLHHFGRAADRGAGRSSTRSHRGAN